MAKSAAVRVVLVVLVAVSTGNSASISGRKDFADSSFPDFKRLHGSETGICVTVCEYFTAPRVERAPKREHMRIQCRAKH